ncbi:exported protein of unknown function [Pseudodesulfovibrio profundus]|uniref:Uncharacterized protein n=1 Tax=Pseudodesulfovibrio profundus TaxID=57320 RepID=A0A2C8FAL9_9BACT|nr:hypothetical protein [Pseudodesulfovibrio profundus]SOB59686.1 exported protein of unknown function [Pseudodesulfovibrio profundus]
MRIVLMIVALMMLTIPATSQAQISHVPDAYVLAANKDDRDKPGKVIITGKGGKVKDVRKSSGKDKKK